VETKGETKMKNESQWCFAWVNPDPNEQPGLTRATMLRAAMWKPGSTITVSFLDGDPAVQNRVKQAALTWTAPMMANLTLLFLKSKTKGNIRISFKYAGSWSVIGKSCKTILNHRKPTMNFGWLTPDTPDDELRRVVCHEFGHALGLVHEHQNPVNPIKWNRQQVITDLSGPPNNWTLDVIEFNMFHPIEIHETNATALDKNSIMMYPIPTRWTMDGFSAGLNTDLSPLDRLFIRTQYP
jgi:serralysin